MTNQKDPFVVDTAPTKELFIDTLIRDLDFTAAILDLLDNSADSAKAIAADPSKLKGFKLVLRFPPGEFAVEDNCAGMEAQVARERAFKFGRDKGAKLTKGSVGIFGVGMKRALFKIADSFSVKSVAATSSFLLNVSVDTWKNSPDWQFKFSELKEKQTNPPASWCVSICCDQLTADAKTAFGQIDFLNKLKDQIARRYAFMMQAGLEIYVTTSKTGESVKDRLPMTIPALKSSEELSPTVVTLNLLDDPHVKVSIYGGVDEKPEEKDAGWSIYCNGRLVVDRDRSELTGWGSEGVPLAHHQFARFRGFVMMECDDPSRLPWNTTKTGIEFNNALYTTVLAEMRSVAKQWVKMLNAARREQKNYSDGDKNQVVLRAISNSPSVPLNKLPPKSVALWPAPSKTPPTAAKYTTISFKKERQLAEQLREALGLDSFAAVGDQAFDELYDREVGE